MSRKAGPALERIFAALSDRTRLRLLNLMRDGEVCVCFFAETLGTNNPKISRHLAYLKSASLVAGRRDGKWMHYRITEPEDPHAAEILRSTFKLLDRDPVMEADRKKLVSVCCRPMAPIGIAKRRNS
ncbi:MAG: metalloregulator ArsR/SmtB family transcription factor [Acidobacteria bacterium]|nr:metalloregulator ArsR/SmtB family transcription factor [Acidobacteriota bacterium]MCW5948089.1 metalloregulator ArsR/SmtB family transcription factor [Pyrinomonadaceae bacterium]